MLYSILAQGGGSGGMPQLDPSSFSSQLFWLAVTFALFYFLMSVFVIPRIRLVLEKRQEQITADMDMAEIAHHEAEEARKAYEAEFEAARLKAIELIATAQGTSDKRMADEIEKLSAKLNDKITKAEKQLTVKKQEALGQLRPVVESLTAEIYEKLTGEKADKSSISKAVDSAGEIERQAA